MASRQQEPSAPGIRPYRDADRDDLYDVCVRTGAAGQDARGLYLSDELLGDVYAGPYAALEPWLAFVLDNGERVVGYVLGTADTERFVERFRREWLPRFGGRYGRRGPGLRPGSGPAGQARPTEGSRQAKPAQSPDDKLVDCLVHPERMLVPGTEAFPAHLHIDLLPAYQGRGYGRALIETFADAVAARGAGGICVGVAPENTRALAFYARVGFDRIGGAPDGGAVYLGRKLG